MHDTSLVQGQFCLYIALSQKKMNLLYPKVFQFQCQARAILHQECQQCCATLLMLLVVFFCLSHLDNNNNNNLQAFQLIVLARYLLGVPNPSPVSQP